MSLKRGDAPNSRRMREEKIRAVLMMPSRSILYIQHGGAAVLPFFFKFRFSVDVFGCLYEAKPLANIANKTKHLNKTFSKWSNGTSVYFCSRLKEEKPIKNGCCPSLVKWRTRRSRSTLMCNRVKSQTFQRSSGLHCLWLRSAPPPQCFVRAEQSRPGRMELRKTL